MSFSWNFEVPFWCVCERERERERERENNFGAILEAFWADSEGKLIYKT